jgi:adenylosuccinate synthase
MINGIESLVVTKLDVLDDLAEIPVCVGYKLNGKKMAEVPSQAAGFEKVECVYKTLPGWQKPTSGARTLQKLPAQARAYLEFLEKETGARIGMVSTGPERDRTIFAEGFVEALGTAATALKATRRA